MWATFPSMVRTWIHMVPAGARRTREQDPSVSSAVTTTTRLCHTQVILAINVQTVDSGQLLERPPSPVIPLDCHGWPRAWLSELRS